MKRNPFLDEKTINAAEGIKKIAKQIDKEEAWTRCLECKEMDDPKKMFPFGTTGRYIHKACLEKGFNMFQQLFEQDPKYAKAREQIKQMQEEMKK